MFQARRTLAIAVLSFALVSCTSVVPGPKEHLSADLASLESPSRPQEAGPRHGSFYVLIGGRELDDNVAWDLLDKPFVFGVEAEFRRENTPVGFEFGTQISIDTAEAMAFGNAVDIESELVEFYGGVRFAMDFPAAPITTYVGLGLTAVFADVTSEVGGLLFSDHDETMGFYIHGGANVWLGSNVSLGVDIRSVTGTDVRIAGIDTDVDYLQVAGTIGFSF